MWNYFGYMVPRLYSLFTIFVAMSNRRIELALSYVTAPSLSVANMFLVLTVSECGYFLWYHYNCGIVSRGVPVSGICFEATHRLLKLWCKFLFILTYHF